MPWGLSHSIIQETLGQTLLSPEDILYLKSLVLDFFWVLRDYRSVACTILLKLPSRPLQNCSMTFFMFDTKRKNRPQLFFHWKDCLFFRNLCFQQPRRSWKSAPTTSTVIVRIACDPLNIVCWGLSHSKIPKIFRHPEKSYFLNFLFLSTFWVLKNWSYYFHSNCQNTFWTFINCFLTPLILDDIKKVFK